jgi:hypothetical protein
MTDDPRLLRLSPEDNVAVLKAHAQAGEEIVIDGRPRRLAFAVAYGHKLAVRPIAKGETVRKYGAPIGSATADIAVGDYVHIHNMRSDYIANYSADDPYEKDASTGSA